MFLAKTVENLLENIEGNTEIIVVLDGAWAEPPLPIHPRLTVIHHNKSVGQRAGTNEAARLSKAKYVMKVDAHCAFDKGFDVKMMALMEDDLTMIPTMYNLHGFDWVCASGHRRYQGPSGPCTDCGLPTTRDIIWKPRWHKKSEFYRFDTELHFQYHGDRKKLAGDGPLVETMSAQGSCFMLTRERYWALNISDEAFGSWGQQGVEVACKTWLSGGKLVTNRTTWYSHMFRTQGGDFGFPYPMSGDQQERARKFSRELFLQNTWKGQIYPLSWLIEKFKPLPGWHDPEGKELLDLVTKAGAVFGATQTLTRSTNPLTVSAGDPSVHHQVSTPTTDSSGALGVVEVGDQLKVGGIATPAVATNNMVKLHDTTANGQRTDQPSVHQAMDTNPFSSTPAHPFGGVVEEPAVSGVVNLAYPVPTATVEVKLNAGEEPQDGIGIKTTDGETGRHGITVSQITERFNEPSKSIIFYTDNQLTLKVAHQVQKNLKRIAAVKGLPIVSVSLKPMSFGRNIHLPLQRGYLTMSKQILAALEASTADVVFFCEHDVLYHESHFDFTPPQKETFYYNENVFFVRAEDGHSLHYDVKQLSGLCVYRETAIEHFKERVAMIEKEGFTRNMGFEPMTHGRIKWQHMYRCEAWQSPYPNLDIKHGGNLTGQRWKKEQYRNQSQLKNWTESRLQDLQGWSFPENRLV